jgi:hypothetical protein
MGSQWDHAGLEEQRQGEVIKRSKRSKFIG